MNQAALRVGAVGCGNVIVVRHIPAVKRVEGAQVVAVADPVEARARMAQEAAGLPASMAFDSLEAMTNACALDYLVVGVPPSARRPIVEKAFELGLDVLTEKPIATRPSEADKMIEQAQTFGRKFGMVHNYLYFPEYRLIRELTNQGEVGELQHIAINLLGVPDDPGNEEYRPRWRHDIEAAGAGC